MVKSKKSVKPKKLVKLGPWQCIHHLDHPYNTCGKLMLNMYIVLLHLH